MPRSRRHNTKFKHPVAAGFDAGEALHVCGRRHDLSCGLIRIWVEKAGVGEIDQDHGDPDLFAPYEAKIATPEPPVGQQAIELAFPNMRASTQPRRGARP